MLTIASHYGIHEVRLGSSPGQLKPRDLPARSGVNSEDDTVLSRSNRRDEQSPVDCDIKILQSLGENFGH